MEVVDKTRRERLIRDHLAERGMAVEEETRRLRAELEGLGRREANLREEISTLDATLGALPQPPREGEAPSLFAPAPRPPVSALPPPPKKRRRKGSRREQVLPQMTAKFGTDAFRAEEVTEIILAAEGGERRTAYFAAWSLCRDLAEDGVIRIASEEGAGPRKKRTYRFTT